MKKIGKLNVKKTATRSAVIAVVGAASQILSTVIEGEADATTGRPANAEIVDYGMIVAGILLPELVKNEMATNAGDALLAVGAYRMAVANDLATKIGVNGIGGSNDINMIGYQKWNPVHNNAPREKSKPASGNTNVQVQ